MTETPDIVPQVEKLIELARAVRPRWDEDELRAAVAGALSLGRGWPYLLASMQVIMNDPKARPRDISPLAARRAASKRPPDPAAAARGRALIDEAWPNGAARRPPRQ